MLKSEDRHQSLLTIRSLLCEFVRGRLEPEEFIPRYRKLFAPFDPPDLNATELSEDEKRHLNLYVRLMGGWFGEEDDSIPRNKNWKYGEDTAPYSWIDGPGYRRWIAAAATEAGVNLEEQDDHAAR